MPSATLPQEKVLIVGAGIAGSVLAYWLAKADFQVTVIERSKAEQTAGQGLEIEEPAMKIVEAMGVVPQLQAKKTGELGFELVDENGRSCGILEAGKGASPTGALEMMRGDMTEIFYKAADAFENVTYHFQTTIHGLRQEKDKVVVELQNRIDKTIRTSTFDLVVGADGARSHTRDLVMGTPDILDCFKPVGAFVAYFSIPSEPHDWPCSQACQYPGRKIIWTRPVGKDSKTTSVHLIHLAKDVPSLRAANAAGDRRKQKAAFAELFRGLGWEAPRITREIMEAENFYSDELQQVKLKTWSSDRVVLLGDAAWAPTPFTGQGNQLAIIGAWVLAQEMSRNRNQTAFVNYEKRLRSFVESSQEIPLRGYAPAMAAADSVWGIWLFRTLFGLLAAAMKSGWLIARAQWVGQFLPEGGDEESSFNLEMVGEDGKNVQKAFR